MPSSMTDDRSSRFQFLLEQFKLHSGELRDYHRERFNFTTWNTLAIFGYFGWVLTNSTEYPNLLLSVLPVLFVSLGFAHVYRLHKIIDRHSAFLNHLEKEMFQTDASTEWEKFKAKGHKEKPLRRWFHWFWAILWIGTVIFSLWLLQAAPIPTDSISSTA